MSESAKKEMRTPIETGCPDGFQYMHPTMRKNFGQWKYHEHPRPGVLVHVAHSGCLLYTSPSPRDMRRSRMPSSA